MRQPRRRARPPGGPGGAAPPADPAAALLAGPTTRHGTGASVDAARARGVPRRARAPAPRRPPGADAAVAAVVGRPDGVTAQRLDPGRRRGPAGPAGRRTAGRPGRAPGGAAGGGTRPPGPGGRRGRADRAFPSTRAGRWPAPRGSAPSRSRSTWAGGWPRDGWASNAPGPACTGPPHASTRCWTSTGRPCPRWSSATPTALTTASSPARRRATSTPAPGPTTSVDAGRTSSDDRLFPYVRIDATGGDGGVTTQAALHYWSSRPRAGGCPRRAGRSRRAAADRRHRRQHDVRGGGAVLAGAGRAGTRVLTYARHRSDCCARVPLGGRTPSALDDPRGLHEFPPTLPARRRRRRARRGGPAQWLRRQR